MLKSRTCIRLLQQFHDLVSPKVEEKWGREPSMHRNWWICARENVNDVYIYRMEVSMNFVQCIK